LYIILTVFLGVSAINTGNNLVYLITAAFLSFLGVSGFFGKSNISRVAVVLTAPDEIYANTPFPLRVRLENRRRYLPSFLIQVRIDGEELLFPYVGAKDAEEKQLTTALERRGRNLINAVHVCSVFPFNFFIRCRKSETPLEMIVFPEPKKCEVFDPSAHARRERGELASGRIGSEGDLVSLRNYAHGDPMKYIHWKASAKTDKLKTKELSSLTQLPVVIDFEKTGIKNLEERISCIAYALLRLNRQRVPSGLRIRGRVFEPGISASHKAAMMRELALYGE
jgi:uncharacterized protein (DUF58 family)